MRRATIGVLIAFLLGCGAIAAGLRINGTPSFPVGFYLASHKHPQKGDLVLVAAPDTPTFVMARDRGYLNVGYSATSHILKRLVGVPGDQVTIDSSGVQVNGIRFDNSAPLPCDGAGRPLQPYALKDYILMPGEALLMSDYNAASFDSRYFGPLDARTIEFVVKPVWTWK